MKAGASVSICSSLDGTISRFDRGRAIFHFEHMVPVKAIRSACLNCKSVDEVLGVLGRARVVWILKSENDELDRLGLRSDRSDPVAAYDQAGIVVVESPVDREISRE
jgi:hypothetical protein